MKKIFYLLTVFMFIACNKLDFVPAETNYNNVFVSTFGTPAKNQNWGFQSITRSANVNGNLWYQNWIRPINITEEEISWAKEEFGKIRKDVQPWQSIEFSDYWVQQVYQGERYSLNGNNSKVFPKDVMNQLIVFNNKKTNVISYWPYEEEIITYEGSYEHVNNFNNATNTTIYTDDETKEKFIGTTLMNNMGTDGRKEQFGYHNTQDSKYHYEYIVIEHNGSYFIGFDIFANGSYIDNNGIEQQKNMRVDRDYIFDDWIIKITPARNKFDVRIIAEDLSASSGSDFDFNDVVFDVTYSNNQTIVTILAAGGTLPLYVNGNEIHQLFNVPISTMVNTGAGPNLQPVSFIISEVINPIDIDVSVLKNNQLYSLKANTGEPASKIQVTKDFVWCDERVDIKTKYPKFEDYVKNPSVVWF